MDLAVSEAFHGLITQAKASARTPDERAVYVRLVTLEFIDAFAPFAVQRVRYGRAILSFGLN